MIKQNYCNTYSTKSLVVFLDEFFKCSCRVTGWVHTPSQLSPVNRVTKRWPPNVMDYVNE